MKLQTNFILKIEQGIATYRQVELTYEYPKSVLVFG